MSELPRGTVTFLFTDIEGSTKLLGELGDAYADALEEHRRRLRDAFAEHEGVEVDTQGDAFLVAFARPSDAGRAALAAQAALAGSPIRVRMGLHTGEPLLRNGGYVGMDVHRGARVMSAGHGGQIVVSERTGSFLADQLKLRDLGVHRLKDLQEPERLFQLGDGEFPPLRTLTATNLPTTATQLLGREREVSEVIELLDKGTRLLTITGAGGTGKTRLALEAAAEFVGRVADGVYWIPLASVPAADLVIPEIAATLGAPDDLHAFLRGRETLLLIDNFEHLLDAAGPVAELLSSSDRLRLVVTSRAALHVGGEYEYVLEPLGPSDSVALFCERARATGRDIVPDPTVEEICRRLDGLPLAIELAAARTKLLGPDTLLERLDRALPLLTGGARDAPERQRTLRATIEWSYDLLDPAARRLFAGLAVFAGSFWLEAAEQICDADIDSLASLVDLSMLKPIGEDRFLVLETINEYAGELLNELPESAEIRVRHAAFFAALAEECYGNRLTDEVDSAGRIELDHDNMRAALDLSAKTDPQRELALAGALGWFWVSHSHLEEGAARLAHALGQAEGITPQSARAHTASGRIAGQLGRAQEADASFARALEQWDELGDEPELASALDTFGWSLFFRGEDDRSLAAFERSLEIRSRLDDEAPALAGVCQVLVARWEVERAERLSRELLELSKRKGDLRSEHFAVHYLADCALMKGDFGDAEDRYRVSLAAARALGDVVEMSVEVQGVAMAAAGKGDDSRALKLAASVEALWESLGVAIDVEFWNTLMDRHIGASRKRLGSEGESLWAEGLTLPFDDAVELAAAESV